MLKLTKQRLISIICALGLIGLWHWSTAIQASSLDYALLSPKNTVAIPEKDSFEENRFKSPEIQENIELPFEKAETLQESNKEEVLSGSKDLASLANMGELAPLAPKMPNQTQRAELGRTSWKLFHTILARYPDNPTEDQKTTLSTFLYLFAQVYPCGDCAEHFVKLLQKYPPQTSSRKTAALWGCHVHNVVNEFLKKDEYDCTKILEDYDCGCGEEGEVVSSRD